MQARRAGARKLFDRARKETFLEWLAATCNVVLSAEKAGICDKTVYKHLLKDQAFVDGFVRAIQVGYLRLEAREMQEAHRPHRARAELESPSPSKGDGYEVRILPDTAAEEHFDPQLAMQLLREHRRHLPGSPEKRPAQRTTARAATSEEVVKALTKRLKGFGLRMQQDRRHSREGGNPAHPGEQRDPRFCGGDD